MPFMTTKLVPMYSDCGGSELAHVLFDKMPQPNVFAWTAILSVYWNPNGQKRFVVVEFTDLRLEGFEPDFVTWKIAMDVYCRMGECDEAWKIFEQIEEANISSWTTLISGHGYGIKMEKEFAFYNSTEPALLTMYARCRDIHDAANVFALMDKSDVVSWNSLIFGFADLGMNKSVLECFRKMQSMGIQNDQTKMSTVLPVCDLESGKQIHACIRKNGFNNIILVCNTLIHTYSKCGCINIAFSVFSEMVSRDLVSWNTMIEGYRIPGATLQLLVEMNKSGNYPNSITFTSVLLVILVLWIRGLKSYTE
ncbi:hypothetical protein RHSIM_Rhsim02G0015200 [Rhododendron simsii]|uniref:Pentatricopeptide repeat-containing protein n=1 Tax=Rhododendron simsii TaxID=118357 RepID=A0A834LVW9_RHOSS|nr:hypothetical protein RHSIM_Rhsim02G0015200 [Rhododendron simsii]